MILLRSNSRQRGYVLVMLVLVLVLLLGIAALALDLGRIYVLRTEMQNAADEAALAAAKELDAKSDAIERARLAGKDLIKASSHFTRLKELLGPFSDNDIRFEFFCSIGTQLDDPDAHCTGTPSTAEPHKFPVTSDDYDNQAHYVRVTLDPDLVGTEGRYGIDLVFLPVLSVLGIKTETYVNLRASALAGRHFYMCNYPPLMLCSNATDFKNTVDVGDQVLLKMQKGGVKKWDQPGIFSILDFDAIAGGGANMTKESLAGVYEKECIPPEILAQKGSQTGPYEKAINTRFGVYEGEFKNKDDVYPTAPNVMSYGGESDTYTSGSPDGIREWRDSNLKYPDEITNPSDRFGNGEWNLDWDANGYFQRVHGIAPPPDVDTDGNGKITRWETYIWETKPGNLPSGGEPPNGVNVTEDPRRRVIYTAVVDCEIHDMSSNDPMSLVEGADGFAEFFITERIGGEEDKDKNFFVEFMRWVSERDEDYRVVIQLYE